MSNSRVEEFERAGIKIELTPQGCDLLSEILNEGCPVKFSFNSFEPISCQYHYISGRYACKRCWKKWLKNFIVEGDKNGTANG